MKYRIDFWDELEITETCNGGRGNEEYLVVEASSDSVVEALANAVRGELGATFTEVKELTA